MLKVLVIGVGNMGASHARSYAKIDGFNLVGLVARSKEKRGILSKELGGIPEYSDVSEALKTAKPDIVSINTYPDTHYLFAKMSLDAGAHVFLEKPIAETVEQSRELVELAAKKNLKIVVGYILRQHPAWQEFIALARTLGKPLVMRMNLNQQSSGIQWDTHKQLMNTMSPIVDCGVHYVDVMCQMTESIPTKVHAIGAKLSDEIKDDMYNYGQLQVTFQDGSIGWYEAGWGPMMSETAFFVKDVVGPNGSVSIVDPKEQDPDKDSSEIDGHTKTNRLLIHYAERDQEGKFKKEDRFVDTSEEPDHQELCDREQLFLLKAITEDLDLTAHLNDAINSLKIVLAADESIKSGKAVGLDL